MMGVRRWGGVFECGCSAGVRKSTRVVVMFWV